MPNAPLEHSRPDHPAGLLLRVIRPNGQVDEFYLAGGLTIGRSMANTIVLADDEHVDRTHARVDVAHEGLARLLCMEPGSSMTMGGLAVRDVPLDVGVRFQIGRAEFECVSGRAGAEWYSRRSLGGCPSCGSAAALTGGQGIRACPDCDSLALPVKLDPKSQDVVLIPADFGEYRVEREVAQGGMGLVFRGHREADGETVAIKVLPPETTAGRKEADLFRREVAMLALIRQPNVVKLLGHGRSGRFAYLAMEWVDGPDLRSLIARAELTGRLTGFDEAIRWFRHVAIGLSAIDEAGLVHRDIKPSNILVGRNGIAKVADLGIARKVASSPAADTTMLHNPGTFEYMAPEQLAAPEKVDRRADLYALGVTFYELLTGRRPVGAWRPASLINPTVPRWFDSILQRLMAPIPNDRFDDAEELLAAILPEKSKGLSTFSLRLGPKDVVSKLPAAEKSGSSAHEPVRVDLGTAPSEPDGPRDRISELFGGAKVGARNGAIWGICTMLPSGLLLASFIQLMVVLETVDAASPSVGVLAWLGSLMSGIALGALIGGTFGGTIGAMWGLLAVIVWGPGSIDPITLSDVARSVGRWIKKSFEPKVAEPPTITSPERVGSRPGVPSAHSTGLAEAVTSPSGFEVGPVSKTGTAINKSKISGGWATWIIWFAISGILRAYFFPMHHQPPLYQRPPISSYETSKLGRAKNPTAFDLLPRLAHVDRVPDSPCNDMGIAHYENQRFLEAMMQFNTAILHDAYNHVLLKNRGLCHRALGSYDFAVADFEAALRFDPSNAALYRKLIDEIQVARIEVKGR